MTIKQAQKKAQKKADDWNRKYAEGQKVSLLKDNGERIETITRSHAYVMCGSAVILLERISGAYLLERATAQED